MLVFCQGPEKEILLLPAEQNPETAMDNDPLLPYQSPWRISPHLEPLPEDNEITLPVPLTPSVLKDLLIFGPSSPDIPSSSSSNFLDALTLSLAASPKEGSQQQDPEVFLPHQWSKSNLHRSKTAPAMAVLNDFVIRHPPVPKPLVASQSIVRQACILLALYLSLGIVVFFFNRDSFVGVETHPVVDALYFCIVTMCTIGYGDITPNSTLTKLFSIMFVLIGFGFIDILLTGMIGYVLDLQENYLLRHVREKTEREKDGNSCFIDVRKGRMRIRMKVALALGVVILCIGVGGCVMHFVEKLGWLDSFYLSVMSVTTVGYGDRAFKSLPGRIFASIWLLVSTLAVARAFLYLAEARVDKRQRMMAKWVLSHDMTVSEFLAADIDNNGFVSKSEYVIYTLKEMGKVSEKSIMEICKQFERLDTGNLGRITLADLRESHQP